MRHKFRHYLLFFALIAISQSVCQAQSVLRIDVPFVKESPEIDSLIESALRDINDRKARNDSCFVLRISRKNSFIIAIHATQKKDTIYSFGDLDIKTLKHFTYRNAVIFIEGDKMLNEFFVPTSYKREFLIVKSTPQEFMYQINNYIRWGVFYRDGKLSIGTY